MRKRHGRVRIIPTSIEKFLALSVGRVLFLDSYQLTKGSLEAMVRELVDEDFEYTKKVFGTGEKFNMITRKGVFPYSMLKNIEQLTKPKEIAFPSEADFFNKLSFQPVKAADYAHGKKVWDAYGCRTLREYHDIYLISDCTLLADCIQKFRRKCMALFEIDPAHYYTGPSFR